jgi:hypothetical protein
MVKPLLVEQKALANFNGSIGGIVRKAFGLENSRHLKCEKYSTVIAQRVFTYRLLDCSKFATRVRNLRGHDIDVFPIILNRVEQVLVGVSFDWVSVGKRFRFSGAQIIVFAGRGKGPVTSEPEIDASARQLLRLEWAGRNDSGDFEAAVAAHPHWQVDAMPNLSRLHFATVAPRVRELRELSEQIEIPEKTWLSALHLPSAAVGWTKGAGWQGDHADCSAHANSPASTEELQAWVASAARYLNHQLQLATS